MSDASLTVNGKVHSGWTEVSVTRSMETLAHTFDLTFTERWSDDSEPVPIREGDECELKIDAETIITGYVDDASIDYDANDHTMRVSGRSKTGDLVDCSAIYKKGAWAKQDIETIANNLCGPFGIGVTLQVSAGDKFPKFNLEDGETVFEALERACRLRGLVMNTSADGELVFTSIGALSTKTVIEYGVNVLKGARAATWKDRFSKYIVKAQSEGDDDNRGSAISQAKVEVTDDVIDRYRPLIIQSECNAIGTGLSKRAAFERNVRAGRAQRLKYTLDGWENDDGIWAPNTIVRVKDTLLDADAEMLVVSVRLSKGADGTNTELELCDPMALTVEPLSVQPKGGDKSPYITTRRP